MNVTTFYKAIVIQNPVVSALAKNPLENGHHFDFKNIKIVTAESD